MNLFAALGFRRTSVLRSSAASLYIYKTLWKICRLNRRRILHSVYFLFYLSPSACSSPLFSISLRAAISVLLSSSVSTPICPPGKSDLPVLLHEHPDLILLLQPHKNIICRTLSRMKRGNGIGHRRRSNIKGKLSDPVENPGPKSLFSFSLPSPVLSISFRRTWIWRRIPTAGVNGVCPRSISFNASFKLR